MLQIVTDSGADLSELQKKDLPIHIVQLGLSLDGENYGKDNPIKSEDFYDLLGKTDSFPTTSQASPGDFVDVYREIAKNGDKILSIHISSGLSGTLNSAQTAGAMVPEADITFWDSKTLSAALGWQVQAAAIASTKGWSIDSILERLAQIRDQVDGMFTLKEMNYLIHGGRVSHIKGLMAQALNIKPIIFVEHEKGIYSTIAQQITFTRAIQKLVDICVDKFGGDKVRVQIVNGFSPDGIALLKSKIEEKLNAIQEEVLPVSPVLGAHTGPSLTGLIIGRMALFEGLI